MSVRRVLLFVSLAAVVAMCIEPRLLQLPFVDRAPFARSMSLYADRRWPQYPRFLEGVRAHTQPGDTIGIIVPAMGWDEGYSYAYYRASYFLTGREVLPFVDPQNRRIPENIRAVRYIAAFGVGLRLPADRVWGDENGALLRLKR